jgi:5-methylcytosine-specific restriction enzyme A
MDLVREAGVDTDDWKNFKKGPGHAASNPKYCYEWSFLQPGRVAVVKLWHDKLTEVDGKVEQHLNLIEDARKEPKGSRAVRRARMSKAIDTAASETLPLRVIIMKRRPAKATKSGKPGSTVDLQLLDPLPWAVHSRSKSGEIILRRGEPAAPYVDQYDLATFEGDRLPERKQTAGSAFARDRAVRQRVLLRAMGICELCKQPGFQLPSGSIYLETHHVIPLSEKGRDWDDNVVAICPNDHREAHHGKQARELRARLQVILAQRQQHLYGGRVVPPRVGPQ